MELTVHLNTNDPVKAEDSVSIICSAKINNTLVDADIDVDMHLVSPQGFNTIERSENVNLGLYQRRITFRSVSAQDSGEFMCNATVKPSSTNIFLHPAYEEVPFDLVLSKYQSLNNCTAC